MYNIEEVRRLSQEEGLNDRQIAERLGCSRVTVTRIRKRHDIPTCEKCNRRDKVYTCLSCGEKIYIMRKERRRAFCEKCTSELGDTTKQ